MMLQAQFIPYRKQEEEKNEYILVSNLLYIVRNGILICSFVEPVQSWPAPATGSRLRSLSLST